MKIWIIGNLLSLVLVGCSKGAVAPTDLEAFIQGRHENKISLIRAMEDVSLKLKTEPGSGTLTGWCVAYEVKNEKGELWKYESLYIHREAGWEDVTDYNSGLAVFPPGIIMDHRWCDY